MEKETRFNENKRVHETNHDLWLTEYDKYVLGYELQMRVEKTKSMRDKCGISPDDKNSEPNMHIASIVKVCEQLGINIEE